MIPLAALKLIGNETIEQVLQTYNVCNAGPNGVFVKDLKGTVYNIALFALKKSKQVVSHASSSTSTQSTSTPHTEEKITTLFIRIITKNGFRIYKCNGDTITRFDAIQNKRRQKINIEEEELYTLLTDHSLARASEEEKFTFPEPQGNFKTSLFTQNFPEEIYQGSPIISPSIQPATSSTPPSSRNRCYAFSALVLAIIAFIGYQKRASLNSYCQVLKEKITSQLPNSHFSMQKKIAS